MRILETLARVELTDGLTVAQLVTETSSRLAARCHRGGHRHQRQRRNRRGPGQPVRRGFAVTALVNIYEEREYAEAAGKLLAEQIDARHLRDEASVSNVCQAHVLQSAPDMPQSI